MRTPRILIAAWMLLAPVSQAQESTGPWSGWWESVSENLRWSYDESARALVRPGAPDQVGTFAAFGLDVHKVFSGRRGDVGTLVAQAYLTRIDDLPQAPPFFEGQDDWELVFRIFNFNYTALTRSALNVRVGHFEVPYGLEHLMDTNGTLRDYTHGRNLGVKADWGVTVNGELPSFEYELGWSRGTGNEWTSAGDPGIVAGRIGTPRNEDLVLGLSGMTGSIWTGGGVIDRDRVGLDVIHQRGPFGLLAEANLGEDQGNGRRNVLGEVNWRNRDETFLAWLQLSDFASETAGDWDDTSSAACGFRFAFTRNLSAALQVTQVIEAPPGVPRRSTTALQLRYRR